MFTDALRYASEASYLEYAIIASKGLEQVYSEIKNYEKAWQYGRQSVMYTDSLNKISKRDDLILLEIDNTAKLREEAQKREEIEKEHRHKIQYTAILILMVVVFVVLIMLGSFRVPKWVIQFMGFISFIFLFEFIILIADQWIHEVTHGEPWKVLAIKVILIGILLPLHEWLEHQVIKHLLTHKLINFSNRAVKIFFKELFLKQESD